jgi:hypothetical protein
LYRYNIKAKIPLNNEHTPKEQKTGMKNWSHWGKGTYGMGIIKEGSKEGECAWCTFYTRLNIDSIPLCLFGWGFIKNCTGLGGGWALVFFCQAKW